MRYVLPSILFLLMPLTAASAQNMTVADFLARATRLEQKGMAALLSSDYRLLKAQVQASGKAIRAEQNAALAARRTPATCMPPKAGFKSSELMAHLRSIPPAQRNMSIKAGLTSLMRKKYPCPRQR